MPDTKRTQSEILGLLPDNTTRLISPQDLRDTVVSQRANQGLGWEFHTETDVTESAAQSIAADTRTKIECDGVGTLSATDQNTDIGSAVWDGTNHKFVPELNSAYLFRITFRVKTVTAGNNWVEVQLDIGSGGLGTGPVIWGTTCPLIKGPNIIHEMQYSIPLFAKAPFPTNGGTFFIESNVAITLWDVRVFFARIYKPDN